VTTLKEDSRRGWHLIFRAWIEQMSSCLKIFGDGVLSFGFWS